jgi:hypothetical protein
MNKLISILIVILFSAPVYAEYKDWRWKSDIPTHFFIVGPPETVRDPNRIDEAFEQLHGPIIYKKIVKTIGRADHFSPQSIYSLKQGGESNSEKTDNSSGTYRYLLKDGGELHIWVLPGDFVGTAIRFEKNGKGHLLYK